MYEVELKNCNNIRHGKIRLERNKLNIKYGINGTGKTTLSRAINYAGDDDQLQLLRSYTSVEPAQIEITPSCPNVMIFNEDFVNNVVFKEGEVIENSFEVFLKTEKYDIKKEVLDQHLKDLKKCMIEDDEIIELKENLEKINSKFNRNKSGTISTTGAMKSLLTKQNLYNIPTELEVYKPFFQNKDINIPWIDWKSKGDNFDIGENCPYCSEHIDLPQHQKRKEIFKNTYKKADAQHLKEMLGMLESLKQYMEQDEYNKLIDYVKTDTDNDIIKAIVMRLVSDLDLIISRFTAIAGFRDKNIAIADIATLDQQVENMEIPKELFTIFGGDQVNAIFDRINSNVLNLKTEIITLKSEMGDLKGLLQATINLSKKDINEFLKTAGINYELEILAEDESNSRTILRQCFAEEKTDVTNIRQHLSWGEKNAFSLILFMYYAQTQNPDIIILDDPISSFDNNKKYAIFHRMFKNVLNRPVSLEGKTVLLLTHDFEPITDFIVVGKLSSDKAIASFMWNEYGKINEEFISPETDVKLILLECKDIACNDEINIVSRVAFLRKLCQLNNCNDDWGIVYEILSCLIHGSEIRRKVGKKSYIGMDADEINKGIVKIREFIVDFSYDDLRENIYSIDGIKEIYSSEENANLKGNYLEQYVKLQTLEN